MEALLEEIIKGDLTEFCEGYCFADFSTSICLSTEDPLTIDVNDRIVPSWKDEGMLARFGKVPIPIAIYKNCNGSNSPYELSPSNPACFRISPQGDAVQIFLYEDIPPLIEDSVIFHELAEVEMSLYYGIPLEVSHRFAVHLTHDYVRQHYGIDELKIFSEFEKINGRVFLIPDTKTGA